MNVRQSETTTARPNTANRNNLITITLLLCLAALGCMPEHSARSRLDRENWDGMKLWFDGLFEDDEADAESE